MGFYLDRDKFSEMSPNYILQSALDALVWDEMALNLKIAVLYIGEELDPFDHCTSCWGKESESGKSLPQEKKSSDDVQACASYQGRD